MPARSVVSYASNTVQLMSEVAHRDTPHAPSQPCLLALLPLGGCGSGERTARAPVPQDALQRPHGLGCDVDVCLGLHRVDVLDPTSSVLPGNYTHTSGWRIVRSFLRAFLASWNNVLRSLLPGCNGGRVESKMKSVTGEPSSWTLAPHITLRLTFFTPSRISHTDEPASVPGMRSPTVKGNETPVELRTDDVMDFR